MMKLNQIIQNKFQEMSKSQKKVANYVTDYPRDVAIYSAQEIGTKIGVSETTVIRFCYKLSLSGYVELQRSIREQLLFNESSISTYQKSKLELGEEPHFYERVMEQDRESILETMNQISETDYESAIDKISQAEKVYVLGLRSSYPAANWLSLTLSLVKKDVIFIRPETEDIIQTLTHMDEKSVAIVISFHRYIRETINFTKLMSEQEIFIIGITDSLLAPIQPFSDILFPVYSPNKSTIDAAAALYSFMNSIVAGLVVKKKSSFEERQSEYNQLDSSFLFVEGEYRI